MTDAQVIRLHFCKLCWTLKGELQWPLSRNNMTVRAMRFTEMSITSSQQHTSIYGAIVINCKGRIWQQSALLVAVKTDHNRSDCDKMQFGRPSSQLSGNSFRVWSNFTKQKGLKGVCLFKKHCELIDSAALKCLDVTITDITVYSSHVLLRVWLSVSDLSSVCFQHFSWSLTVTLLFNW